MQIDGNVTIKELVIEPHVATSNEALTITAKPTMTKKAPIPSAKLLGFQIPTVLTLVVRIPTVLTLVVRIHLFPQHMPFLDLEVTFSAMPMSDPFPQFTQKAQLPFHALPS